MHGLKARRHHNTTGQRQIRRGRTREQVKHMAHRLGVPYGEPQAADAVDPVGELAEREPPTRDPVSCSSCNDLRRLLAAEQERRKEADGIRAEACEYFAAEKDRREAAEARLSLLGGYVRELVDQWRTRGNAPGPDSIARAAALGGLLNCANELEEKLARVVGPAQIEAERATAAENEA